MPDIRITHEDTIFQPRSQGAYPIQEADWERLKKFVRRVAPAKALYQVISNFSFGVAASAAVALIPVLVADNVPTWVVPLTASALVIGLALGGGFLWLDGQQRQVIQGSIDAVLDEMEEMEKLFQRPGSSGAGSM